MLKATMTQKELTSDDVNWPKNGRCKSGHNAPGVRFFLVTGSAVPAEVRGVYCEPCLIVANKMKRQRLEDPEAELNKLIAEAQNA